MSLSKINRLGLYNKLKKNLKQYSSLDIENGVMFYCLNKMGCNSNNYSTESSKEVAHILEVSNLSIDLETIIEFFESLIEEDNKGENGIVFTPQYIAEYISSHVFSEITSISKTVSVIDPGCGCGIFLVAVAEYLLSKTSWSINTIINNNIYGIDIVPDNVRRCNLILTLLSAKHDGDYMNIKPNIICADSLNSDWSTIFNTKAFDYIVGNPPYVNPHDMSKETIEFLKNNFSTTKNGVFNIFYAFIEKGVKELNNEGMLSFILPNNFLTIKSALALREFLQSGLHIKSILDFGDNMVFKPVRTYNCILQLDKKNRSQFEYFVLTKCNNIEDNLSNIKYKTMSTKSLDKNGWKLVDERTYTNLQKIESQSISIKEFIRTGIATLRDKIYLVEHDEVGYYKQTDKGKYYIEDGLVKPIYKVSDLKLHNTIAYAKRYIIFPYIKSKTGYILINEFEFSSHYPKTYNYLRLQKEELDARDKGKGTTQGWYAYGRTQGLNKYGRKLLFPTFANKPKFMYIDDESALFCNGYAVFENDKCDLDVLMKLLNSCLMDYYVSNTSYSIEGGYYCYQKKYVERFSIPRLTKEDITFIRSASNEELDNYLWNLYGLD